MLDRLCNFIVEYDIDNFRNFFVEYKKYFGKEYFQIIKANSGILERLCKGNYLNNIK